MTLTSCSDSGPQTSVHVYADSSLVTAFDDIASHFHVNNPNVNVKVTYGNPDAVAKRLSTGARDDVVAVAGAANITAVRDASMGDPPTPFATNQLAIVTPKNNPAHIHTIRDLARSGTKVVLASPDLALGRLARAALAKAGIAHEVHLLPDAASARAVVAQARRGIADAGICYATDVAPAYAFDVFELVIPRRYNSTVTYEIAPVSDSYFGGRLAGFVISSGGQEILASYGYGPPPT